MIHFPILWLMPTKLPYSQQMFKIYRTYVCVVYSKRWIFKYGVAKSKCMIVGKCSLYQDPKWRLGDKCLCNEESLNILGNVFNRGGNNASYVTNRLTKCRVIFELCNAGMLYPGGTPDVQAYLYKCICQSTLTYG